MIRRSPIIASIVTIFCTVALPAFGQVATPKISSASFDANGKLLVQVRHEGIEGCYLTINGGLARNAVTTGIISTTVTAKQASTGKAKILTRRKYYCKQRKLYINAELTCLNSVVGQATSEVVAVKVPAANLKG